jgi:hypothetical protein
VQNKIAAVNTALTATAFEQRVLKQGTPEAITGVAEQLKALTDEVERIKARIDLIEGGCNRISGQLSALQEIAAGDEKEFLLTNPKTVKSRKDELAMANVLYGEAAFRRQQFLNSGEVALVAEEKANLKLAQDKITAIKTQENSPAITAILAKQTANQTLTADETAQLTKYNDYKKEWEKLETLTNNTEDARKNVSKKLSGEGLPANQQGSSLKAQVAATDQKVQDFNIAKGKRGFLGRCADKVASEAEEGVRAIRRTAEEGKSAIRRLIR